MPAPGSFGAVVRSRRMVRSFTSEPIEPEVVRDLIATARRGPSAGNVAAMRFLVLDDPGSVDRYWSTTLPSAEKRASFSWPGLLRAPVLVIPCCAPGEYVARYGEADKRPTGLGESVEAWRTPYWYVDGGAAVMLLLLAATEAGLGALLFGQFDHTESVKQVFGVPTEFEPLGTIALGHPDGADPPGRSVHRSRLPLDAVVHRGRWSE